MDGSDRSRPVRLPLTEAGRDPPAPERSITPQVIASIVDRFYTRCRADPVLGPIFDRHVHDWDEHMGRLRAFWGAALLGTGGYSGRPLQAHLGIDGLSSEHFSVWLRLFRETLDEHTPPLTPADAGLFLARAGRMANRIIAEARLADE